MAILSGRMSCVAARFSVMTKMFSFSRIVLAGKLELIFIGIVDLLFIYNCHIVAEISLICYNLCLWKL